MPKQRPEPGVEYAAFPTEEYRAQCRAEVVQSLARHLGVTEYRAMELLGDQAALTAEIRALHPLTPVEAMRRLAARTASPKCWCGCS